MSTRRCADRARTPWCLGMVFLELSGELLHPHGVLVLHGPFKPEV
jgi:hypothetical protein